MKKAGEIVADMTRLKKPEEISKYLNSLGTKELINLQLFSKDLSRLCEVRLRRMKS